MHPMHYNTIACELSQEDYKKVPQSILPIGLLSALYTGQLLMTPSCDRTFISTWRFIIKSRY